MIRRLVIFSLIAFCLADGLAAEALATPPDPFEDVPSHHWAYRAVERLRRAGILEGWGHRFHGRKTFTRYEMAVVVARFLEKARNAVGAEKLGMGQRADLTGLCDEYRNEISMLGVRYESLARDMLVTKRVLGNLVAQVGMHRVMLRRLGDGQKELSERVTKLESARPRSAHGSAAGSAAGSSAPLASPSEVRALLERSIAEARAGRLDPVEARTVGYLSNKLLREIKDERYLKNLVRETLREEGLLRP